MAKRSDHTREEDAGAPVTPGDQLSRLEGLPEAPTKASVPQAPPAPSAVENPKSVKEALGPPAAGELCVVMPGFDPLHVKGRPGSSALLYGSRFFKEVNGDLIGNMPEAAAKAYVDVGKMVLYEDHQPAAPRSSDDVERARRNARSLRAN